MLDSPEDCVPAKKPKLEGEAFVDMKQSLRDKKKKVSAIPRLNLLLAGQNASLAVNVKAEDRVPIFLSDVQHLLLYSLLGNHSPYVPDRWCKLEKYSKVSHTLVITVEGLSLDSYTSNKALFDNLTSMLEYKLEMITPTAYGGSIIEELAAVPFSTTQKKNLINKFGSLEVIEKKAKDVMKLVRIVFPVETETPKDKIDTTEKEKSPPPHSFSRTDLILSPWQLVEENYPIPIKGGLAKKYANYTLTKDSYTEVGAASPMFGVDCEMCKTTAGSELTRVSIVDEQHRTVYDTLVMPHNRIVDYLTQYSGITAVLLEGVTTRLSDVQTFIRDFLPPDAILIGQSLNSDMHALRMMHPYIIDTSVIFNITGDRYRKSKLKVLAREFLNLRIQKGRAGHCSTEDSLAAMRLVQLKLKKSLSFGDAVLDYRTPGRQWPNRQWQNPQLKQTADNAKKEKDDRKVDEKDCTYATPIFAHVARGAKSASVVGCREAMQEYVKIFKSRSSLRVAEDRGFDESDEVRLVLAESNDEAVRRCAEVAMEHGLNFCHLRVTRDEEAESETMRRVDEWVGKIWRHVAVNGLVCVIFAGEKDVANGACFVGMKKNVEVDGECL